MSNITNKNYRLVWNQEFDDSEVDFNVWSYQYLMSAAKEFKVVGDNDPRIISVSDSMLHLNSVIYFDKDNPDIKYAVAPTLHTGKSMSFKYGYLEMRARVPFKKGAWPSLWLSSRDTLNAPLTPEYSAEVDVFENFGSTGILVPNIHKWYNDENGNKIQKHSQYPKELKKVYTFKQSDTLSEEFHIYGFEWTPENITMSVDGEEYMTFNLSFNFDNDSDMSGFRHPLRIMLNNHLFTQSSPWIASEGYFAGDEDFPMEYDIDYLRLYQKPDLGELNLKECNNVNSLQQKGRDL